MTDCAQTIYGFSTSRDQPFATHLLVFMAQRLKTELPCCVDFASAIRLGGFSQWDYKSTDEDGQQYSFELGEGSHSVLFQDRLLTVDVTVIVSADVKAIVTYETFQCKAVNKQFTISGIENKEQMHALLREASDFVSTFLRQEGGKRRVVNFLYQPREQQFVKLGYLQSRELKSLFLKENEADMLFGAVGDFLKSKVDYERCSVPYKLNMLLHGVPGSGKTSVIKAMASHFGLNVAIIPFSPSLTDDALARGLSKACSMGCRLIALEDVDCVFEHNRKPNDATAASLTLSGLLNCMDGILRSSASGMIMVLTANLTTEIDEAVLRTARMDTTLEFTHADKFQTQACFNYYAEVFGFTFTEEEWGGFWDSICCFQFTTALLQQFFFHARKDRAKFLDAKHFKYITRNTGKESIENKEKKGWFYT